jgi:hypothetical protein
MTRRLGQGVTRVAEKIFTYEYDGLKFQVILTEENGVVSAQIKVLEGWADFNAFYWGDDDHSGKSETLPDKNLNMNGEGSQYTDENGDTTNVQWDGAQKLSDVGLGKGKENNIVSEGETSGSFILAGVTSLDDIDFFGVRATSVNGEGSIKGVAVPDEPEEPEVPDDFPEFPQDISNIVLYFKQTEGDTKPQPEGDGYYLVKIDNVPGEADDDLDNWIGDVLAWLIAHDDYIDADSDLLGAAIKGGTQTTQFYAYGDNNTNGTDPDPFPDGAPIADGGGGNVPGPSIDQTYQYDELFA